MRGYKMSGIEEGEGDSKFKIFWLGVVEGVTWGFSKSLPDSDSRASYSTGSRMSSSVSGYYAQSSLYSSAINLTDYSKLCITATVGSGTSNNGTYQYGITNNIGINQTFTKVLTTPGAGNFVIDISNLQGNYYFKIFESSGNRNSKSVEITHIWLEK